MPKNLVTLLNFLLFLLKYAIWVSRLRQLDGLSTPAIKLFSSLLHQRINEDHYYALNYDISKRESFLETWCYKGLLCKVNNHFDITYLFVL